MEIENKSKITIGYKYHVNKLRTIINYIKNSYSASSNNARKVSPHLKFVSKLEVIEFINQ